MSSIMWTRTCAGQTVHQHSAEASVLWSLVTGATGLYPLWPSGRGMTLPPRHRRSPTPDLVVLLIWRFFFFFFCRVSAKERVKTVPKEDGRGLVPGSTERQELREKSANDSGERPLCTLVWCKSWCYQVRVSLVTLVTRRLKDSWAYYQMLDPELGPLLEGWAISWWPNLIHRWRDCLMDYYTSSILDVCPFCWRAHSHTYTHTPTWRPS